MCKNTHLAYKLNDIDFFMGCSQPKMMKCWVEQGQSYLIC